MQEQSMQFIANLKLSIRYSEELVLRAKVLTDNANPAQKREWERELERRQWQVGFFRDMLQVAEEDIQNEGRI